MGKIQEYFDPKFRGHPFFKGLHELSIDLLKRNMTEFSEGFQKSLRDFSYHHEIPLPLADIWILHSTKALFKLDNSIESLRYAATRLEELSIKKKTPTVEIRYYIENYLVRFTTVKDTFLQFLNEFYSIGVPARYVTEKIILRNANIINSITRDRIGKLIAYINARAYLRNRILHHADFVNDSYRILSIIENSEIFPPATMEDFKKLFRDEESEKIQEELNSLSNLITAVFDTLSPKKPR